MATHYHQITSISRSAGANAVDRAAYRHATKMEHETGQPTKDYGGKADELKHSQIMLPADAPTWAVQAYGEAAFQAALKEILAEAAEGRIVFGTNETAVLSEAAGAGGTRVRGAGLLPMDVAERMAWARLSQRLWQDIERVETEQNRKPKNAILAREITIAMPRGLSREAQIDLTRGYIREAYTGRGMMVDWVLHDKGDGNPHAHLMLPTRFLDVDAWGGKYRHLDRGKGITEVRRIWERHANMILEREGLRDRVDMRSLADRGIQLGSESYSARIAENAEKAGGTPTSKIAADAVRKRNQAHLRENPEHILTVLQSRLASFTEAEIRDALADRLDLTPEKLPDEKAARLAASAEIKALTERVTASAQMIPMAAKTAEGEQLYITRARAEQGARLAADSARLVASRMAPELVASGDAFETGSGPILVDIGPVVAAREEEERAAAERARREREPAPAPVRGGRPQISIDAVREALRARADDLFRDAFGPPVRPGAAEWRAKANEGIAMQMRGERRGLWRDHTAGIGGDPFDLAARILCGLDSAKNDFPRVLREAAGWAGIAPGYVPDPERVAALRKERERAAAAEDAQVAVQRATLVREFAARAVPAPGTPAAIYLAGRHFKDMPAEGLAYLPAVQDVANAHPDIPILRPTSPALVVWATDADGRIQGGQRILIDTDGTPVASSNRKPNFANVKGFPGRFPARDAELAKGPLIVAEGPESALAAWEATGLETWTVFGVGGFASAPLPEGRSIILAPDRDAPESTAGRAFRLAVAEFLERGHDLRIAMAPEPSGSKEDLNDTLKRAGLAEVKAAIDAARPVRAWLPPGLNAGQREAAEAMLGPDRLTLVKGHAGTGKTHTLRAVAAAWQARGVEVLAGAPSGKATQELARIEGASAATLSAWESRWERGEVPKGPFVFLMDEAGMVGVEQWARVQSRVLAMGGKLVGIGDPEQLRPVGDLPGWASAAFAAHDIPVVDQVLRQADEADRAAVTALARGRDGIRAGLDHFLASGAVRLEADVLADPVAALADAYWDGPEESRIALAYSNHDVDRLNAAIRDEAVSRGIVNDARAIEVTIARERRWRSAGGGAHVRRDEAKIRLGPGDRVLLTRPAPEIGLPRSGFGTVTEVADGRVTVQVDGRQEPVTIDPAGWPHLDHGFAATIHKAQGMTADAVSVLPHARMDGNATYVALSRHRDRVTVFGRKGHLETAEQFHLMGVRVAAPPAPKTEKGRPAIRMPEAATTDRLDWQGSRRSQEDMPLPGLAGDAHLQSTALRTAGLLSADRAEGDPILKALPEGRDDFTAEPRQAVETLVARHGVIRAEELAATLAAPVADPETFLRLFAEAVRHPDLVALPGGDASREGDPWVYTTTGHLRAELAAVDRAMRMAARSGEAAAAAPPEPGAPLSASQREALGHAMQAGVEGGGLALVAGGTASGKTRLAAEIARAHKARGKVVTVLAATAAGRSALEAHGTWALTLEQFLAEPPAPQGEAGQVIVIDDAHTFGAYQADAAFARAEATGAGVVAILDPSRRPRYGGAVFRALADRTGAPSLEGVQGVEGPLAKIVAGLASGGEAAAEPLASFRAKGGVTAAGDRDGAIARVAADFVADPAADRIALAWSRADADALTDAIRAALDRTMPERLDGQGEPFGPLAGLRPGDRIRFTVAGWCGTVTGTGRKSMILRGDRAEVLEPLPGGGLRLRVTGLGGTREIDAVPDGPVPPWAFAFASTVAAAEGTRHGSVHLLASPGLDRATLAAGAAVATDGLRITLPVAEERAGAILERIAGRDRPARIAADHGFDPALAATAAAESPLPALVRPVAHGVEDVRLPTAVPGVRLDAVRARRANAEHLKGNPEHVLAIVQADKPVFTETDVRQALRERLGASVQDADLAALGDRVMRSEHLVTLATEAPDGAPQHVTTARAETMRRAHSTARQLAAGRFEPGNMPVERGDMFASLNPGQARAAEAMLGPERLTLVQGHAGTGKTHTLRAVASAWQARGVEVLAGAPSGKAVTELAAIEGVETGTLARWEARWQKGDVPKEGAFVFVMDEAGMVGAGAWSRVQERVLAMGGKLVAVGDPDQLQPVSDMPGWAIAERAAGQGHVTVIDHVVRQADRLDAEATRRLALGGENAELAVRHYQDKDALRIEGEVRADPVAAAARAHARDMEDNPGGTRMSLAFTNRDVHALNDAIRAEALARGAIAPETVRNYGRIERRVRGDDGELRITYAPRDLGVGDRIMTVKASEAWGLPKSAFGTVTRTYEDDQTGATGVYAVFDGREHEVQLNRDELEDVDHGHAATIHKSQGMTADSVFVLPHRRMHRHATYVALSRHKERMEVFGRAGHLDRPADLVRMAQAAGTLDTDLLDGEAASADADRDPAPWQAPAGLAGRADWRARGVDAGRADFVADARFMAVAERTVGLLAVGRAPDPDRDRDPDGLARDPGKAVDAVMRRSSVFRDEDVASQLARVCPGDPDTFLRLFREAMSRPDLVVLAEDDGRGGRVWTTEERLKTETAAVDRGIRLALDPAPADAPAPLQLGPDFGRERGLSPAQETAVRSAARQGRLRLVAGDAGSGKTSVAAIVADVHERAGRQVIAVAPTGAGKDGLREAGLSWKRSEPEGGGGMQLLTLHSLERGIDEGWVRMDPNTLVVLDDAPRVGADRAARLLERVDESGAKLVAFLDDGALAPPEAGPVFQALQTRLGATRLDEAYRWDARRAVVMTGLMRGGEEAERAVGALVEDGCLVAAGDRPGAVRDIAKAYVADETRNKVAVAWSHKDVDALNDAIRKRLDKADPARKGYVADAEGPARDLKPGDRIRFTAGTPSGSAVPDKLRVQAGETAEHRGRDKAGRAMLSVRAHDGTVRDVTLSRDAEIPQWRYAFAGTIAGEAGRVTDSVHMLASPGMSRQLLATGARLHADSLRIVAPVDAAGLERAMGRVVARDATPESVLDHGFDASLAAREAMRGRSVEIEPEETRAGGVSTALGRLREIARLGEPDPSEAPLRGLEGEVMAEVIGAAVLRHGEAPEGRDRLALESHVEALADPRAWRGILRQAPAGTVREADEMAVRIAGDVPGDATGRAPTTARILARGALTARALGEGAVANLFEDGLRLYGRRASLARAIGRPEELVPARATESAVREARDREAADRAANRGATSAAGGQQPQRVMPGPRRRARGMNVTRMLDDLEMSDERLAEEAFGIFLPKRRRRRVSSPEYRPRVERCRQELRLGGDWPDRAEAVQAAREEIAAAAVAKAEAERAQRATTAERPADSPDRAGEAPKGTRDLALRIAMAVSTRTPVASPVHAQDLQKGIAAVLDRTGAAGGAGDPVAAIVAADPRSDLERELAAAVREAAGTGPLPEAGALRSARSDLLAELSSSGLSPKPQPDLGERITRCFTQGEILALHDMRRPLPESLEPLDRDSRRVVSNHLRAFAELDDPTKAPEPDPLPVVASMLARPEARDTFAALARSASLDELHALRDPDAPDPDGMAGRGTEGRQRIAEVFRSGPVPGREDAAPDPRFVDDVLVLSCAVSERIDAEAPFHRTTLPRDVEAVLRDAANARNVPGAEVEDLAFGIARKRAETDLRVGVAREIDEGEIHEVHAQFQGNPDFVRQDQVKAWKAGVAKGMRRLHREEPLPTGIELRVARAVLATHGTARQELAMAMAEALERGTTLSADGIRKERAAVLGQLEQGTRDLGSYDERLLLRRVYRNFTGAEVREICEGRGPVLERLSDGKARATVKEEMVHLHGDTRYPEPSPWRARHDALAKATGADRYLGAERGMSAEIEI